MRSGKILLLLLPLALMVIFLVPDRSSLLRWKADADMEVILMSGPEHDVSRWWHCSWSNECPKHTWQWCLRLVPRTPEGAWRIYKEYYEAEIEEVERTDRYAIKEGSVIRGVESGIVYRFLAERPYADPAVLKAAWEASPAPWQDNDAK